MTEAFLNFVDNTLHLDDRNYGSNLAVLRAFVKEVRRWQESDNFNSGPTDRYNGYPMFDKVVRELGLEEK